jgi:hypothetical protein
MPRSVAFLVGVGGAVGLCLSVTLTVPAAPAARIDPVADRVLRRMCEYLQSKHQFRFEAMELYDEVRPSGQKVQYSRHRRVAVRRPNRIYSEANGDTASRRFWYDGKTITLLDRRQNLYGQTKAARDIDSTLDGISQTYGLSLPLMDLLFHDPYAALTEKVASGAYMGVHQVEGSPAHHLAFTQENVDWQIWVDLGSRPLPRKVVISYKSLPSQPQYQATLSRWDVATRLSDTTFQFHPPKGAAKIEVVPLGGQPESVQKPGQKEGS